MKRYNFKETKPTEEAEILFKAKSNGRILLSHFYPDSEYLVGCSSSWVDDDYDFEDVEWWMFTKDL
jgi:hypothetical protein